MSTLHTYIPEDRLRALARGETLAERTNGSALFADISGFTHLTETLSQELGTRRGSEELTQHLGGVYSALIAEIEKYGGSVIAFAGDAMMCWFDEAHGPAAPRAVACAVAMKNVMFTFAAITIGSNIIALSLKVTIASGNARRFVVGEPDKQQWDILAGGIVTRTSIAERHAQKDEILVDEATTRILGESLTIKEWREDEESKERFAVLRQLEWQSSLQPRFPALLGLPAASKLMTWMPREVYEREQFGEGSFLTELRPCVVMFVRFMGIDYDSDSAESELDAFIRRAQKIVETHEGTLMDIIIGDKGSYIYICFGALGAHEDDAYRAVKTALELRSLSSLYLQIGITKGTLRVGAYGGTTRKSFGALGDDVNLAARLMTTANKSEILLSGHAQKAVENQFTFEPRPPLPLKGKVEPLPVFVLTGERQKRAIRLQEPTYSLPMVGRQIELQLINEKLGLAADAKAQIIGIVAEAGMGKSRLVAESIRLAHKKGFVGYGGSCQSDGINTPYLAWKSIWQAFFDVDPSAPLKKQLRHLEAEIEDRVPERVQALPLLGNMLNLEIPDNDFTKSLEPKYKQSALWALLEDCLRSAAKDAPLLIVVEDIHWIDALSHDLLEELARRLNDCCICFVLAYRLPQLPRLQAPRLEAMPNYIKIELHELTQDEALGAIRAKLAQLYPARPAVVPEVLAEKLVARSQGNPFYLEELLNFLRDRGLDPLNPNDIDKIELPDSLYSLILSRLDQLSEREKTILRVASVIGRLFRMKWLTGYYPELGELNRVKADLDALAETDITPLASPEPELAYLFKHIVTHEVTYESMSFGTRVRLHEQLAQFLEGQIVADAMTEQSLLDTLVHHYNRSTNPAKQITYLRKAAQAALNVSAFNTAADYLAQLVQLIPSDNPKRSALSLQLAEAYHHWGDEPAARAAVAQAQAAAQSEADHAAALALLGEMTSLMGNYAEAQLILAEAVPLARTSGDQLTLCRALYSLGDVKWRLGQLDDAKVALNETLILARALGDIPRELFALNRLAAVVFGQQDGLSESERILKEIYTRAMEVGNRYFAGIALGNLGVVAFERDDYAIALEFNQKSLALAVEIGSQRDIAKNYINIAEVEIQLGELAVARVTLRKGLAMAQRLGAMAWVVGAVIFFAKLAYAEGQIERALALLGLARSHPAFTNDDQRDLDATLGEWALDASRVLAGLASGAELEWERTIRELLG